MRELIQSVLRESADVKLRTADLAADDIARAGEILAGAYTQKKKVIAFGNGGSAADAQHFVAELVGRFVGERPALPAIALSVNSSSVTSISNDYGFDLVFTRQLEAFAEPGDVAVGISTSGNSPSVLKALVRARELGAATVGLSGRDGGAMKALCDVCVVVPSIVTARIQETHIAVIHIWCEMIERALFGDAK
jgi:D-sedoheptulose 7-phosphate isomerase